MEALHDIVKAGYARYIGMSSCYAWQCKPHVALRVAAETLLNPRSLQSTRCRIMLVPEA